MSVIEEPSAEVGEELRQFFIQLLSPENLESYNQGRETYLSDRETEGLSPEASRILREGTLAEIEANIALASTGSGESSFLMWIVWPFRI